MTGSMWHYDWQHMTSLPQAVLRDTQVLRFLEDLRSHPDVSSVCGMIHKVIYRHHASWPAHACIVACIHECMSFFGFFFFFLDVSYALHLWLRHAVAVSCELSLPDLSTQ